MFVRPKIADNHQSNELHLTHTVTEIRGFDVLDIISPQIMLANSCISPSLLRL